MNTWGEINQDQAQIAKGGRMTKFRGMAASRAPGAAIGSSFGRLTAALGSSVSARALSVRTFAIVLAATPPLALSVTGAGAGVCVETPGGSGIFVCSGPANAGVDVTQNLSSPAGGDLVVTTAPGFGIDNTGGLAINLDNAVGGGNITFTDSNGSAITGSTSGMDVDNFGSGFTLITTTGAVTGTAGDGIDVNNVNGTSLTIDAQGQVIGDNYGIQARNSGNDDLLITTQAVTGTNLDGINAYNSANGDDLTIVAQGAVSGGDDGIEADNDGIGALSITTQAVTGQANEGIGARNSGNGTSLTVNAQGSVSGDGDGIYANNSGDGALSITTQAVSGRADDGIDVRVGTSVTSVTIIAQGAVSGGDTGIDARNYGIGAMSITTQAVTGIASDGIFASTDTTSTSLTITALGTVSGGDDGIDARNLGEAGLTITTGGDVTGSTGQGIYAYNSANDVTSSLLITQAAGTTITGAADGIYANNLGGSLTINASGNVTGGDDGIDARNIGSRNIAVTVGGAITGGSGYGIATRSGPSGTAAITLNAGAAVSSTAGGGIFNDAGDSTTTVNAGASVAGAISLGDGSDDLIFAGGDFSGVTLFDGGDDTLAGDGFIDTLTFAGSSGAANAVNWENVVIGAGSTISFSGNALTTGSLAINAGGRLDATSGALVLTTDVTNAGIITAQDGAANDTITVTGDYTGGGELRVDADFATDTADTLVVNGNVSGGVTTVRVSDISTGAASGNDVLVVDVAGTVNASDFVLSNPVIGAFAFNLALVGNDFFLQQTGLNPATPTFEALPQIFLDMNTLPTLSQRTTGLNGSSASGAGIQPAGGNFANNRSDAIWVRAEGARSNVDANTSTTGSSYDLDQWKIRLGIDGQMVNSDGGSWLVGINGYYTMANADISSATGNGSIDTKGGGIGLTSTWFGASGFYLDAQAQISLISSDLTDAASGTLVNNNLGWGYAAGLEAGSRLAINTSWTIIPQVQLTYSAIDFESFTAPGAAVVSLDDGDSLKGRVGLNLDRRSRWSAADGSTSSSKFYTIANLYYEFSGQSQVDVSGTKFINQPDRFSGELGLGGALDWGDSKYALFSEISTSTSLENFGDSFQFKGTAGIRVSF